MSVKSFFATYFFSPVVTLQFVTFRLPSDAKSDKTSCTMKIPAVLLQKSVILTVRIAFYAASLLITFQGLRRGLMEFKNQNPHNPLAKIYDK